MDDPYRSAYEQVMAEIRAEIEAEGDVEPPPDPRKIDKRLPGWYQEVLRGKRDKPPRMGTRGGTKGAHITERRVREASYDWGRQSISKRRPKASQ